MAYKILGFSLLLLCLGCKDNLRQESSLEEMSELSSSNSIKITDTINSTDSQLENLSNNLTMMAYLLKREFPIEKAEGELSVLVYRRYDCSDCIEQGYEAINKISSTCEKQYREKSEGYVYVIDGEDTQITRYEKNYNLKAQNITSKSTLSVSLGDVHTPVLIYVDSSKKIRYATFIKKSLEENKDIDAFISVATSACLVKWGDKVRGK